MTALSCDSVSSGWNGAPLAQPASTSATAITSIGCRITAGLPSAWGGRTPRELDGLAGAVAHVGGHDEAQSGVDEHLLALLDVGALGAQHDGQGEPELSHGGDDALGQPVDTQDAAEDVDEDRLDAGVGRQDPEGVLDLLGRGAAAHVQEVGGLADG